MREKMSVLKNSGCLGLRENQFTLAPLIMTPLIIMTTPT